MKKTSYAQFIKNLREERALAQSAIAETIGMSRASYVAVEKGTKELTLKEAVALTKLFGITIDELVQATAPDLEKYRHVILAFLRESKQAHVTLKKTKLACLLYLADFAWYYTTGKSLCDMHYRRIAFGPVPDEYFRILEEMEQGGIISVKQIYRDDYHMYELEESRASAKKTLTLLSKKELAHIHKIWTQWEKASTAEITTFVCSQHPYQQSVAGEIINYELIKGEDAYNVY